MNGTRTETLVVVEKSSHRVAFYDLATHVLQATVPCPDYPHEMIVDGRGRYAYVSEYGLANSGEPGDGGAFVLAIDLQRRAPVRRLDCRPYRRVHGIRLDALGRLYALSESGNVLMTFDRPESDEQPARAVPVGGLKAHLFALAPDGGRAWCMNLLSHTVTRVNPHDASVAPVSLSPGSKPEGVFLSADGARLFVTNRNDDELVAIDPERMSVVARAPSGRDPTRAYGTPSGPVLVTAYGGGEILLHDPDTLAIVARVALGGNPIAVSVHPERPEAYVSLTTDEVVVLDLDTLVVKDRLPTGKEPDCSAVIPWPGGKAPGDGSS